MILFASQFPEERHYKNKAWELLTYYFVEALDCHAVNNKQSPRHMI